jgi:TRAP-type C4-dicarboxylate transport system permease small subunit
MEAKETQGFVTGIRRCLDKTDQFLVIIAGGMLVFLTLMITIDVTCRYLFNTPIPASAEATELIMPYIAFGALAYTLAKGSHVRITLLNERSSKPVQVVLGILASVVGFVFCAYLTYKGWLFFWESFVIREEMLAIIKLPWWFGKFAMPLGYLFLTLRFLFNLLAISAGRLAEAK